MSNAFKTVVDAGYCYLEVPYICTVAVRTVRGVSGLYFQATARPYHLYTLGINIRL